VFDINAVAIMADDTTWAVYQLNGEVPQRYMLEHPLWPDITKTPFLPAMAAKWMIPEIRCKTKLNDIVYFRG
jgi:hypothetical protein